MSTIKSTKQIFEAWLIDGESGVGIGPKYDVCWEGRTVIYDFVPAATAVALRQSAGASEAVRKRFREVSQEDNPVLAVYTFK